MAIQESRMYAFMCLIGTYTEQAVTHAHGLVVPQNSDSLLVTLFNMYIYIF